MNHMNIINTSSNELIKSYGDLPVWINWKREQIGVAEGNPQFQEDGSPKITKIPISPVTGRFASVSNPETWGTYDQALIFYSKADGESIGIGLVFTGIAQYCNDEVVGVDLDHYIENIENIENGENGPVNGPVIKDDRVTEFYIKADTLATVSQSGTGIHFYFVTEDKKGNPSPFVPAMNKKTGAEGFEVYSSRDSDGVKKGRYFAETGNIFGGQEFDKPVRHLTCEELVDLLKILGYKDTKDTQENYNSTLETQEPNSTAGFQGSDEELLEAAFNARNGEAFRAVYNGDASKWKGDMSSADESLCMSLAFWTGKDAKRMERIWVRSPLGSRDKTQKREDYRNSTIAYAIEKVTDVYKPTDNGLENGTIKWVMTDSKIPRPECNGSGAVKNIFLLLENDERYRGTIRRNTFSHQPEVRVDNRWKDLDEEFVRKFIIDLPDTYPFLARVNESTIVMAMMAVADKYRVNPIREFVLSLEWDRVSRLDQFLHKTYHCPDDEIHQQMGAFFLMGMMSRILTPGKQFDTCLCLISGQGLGKSQSLRILGASPDPGVTWHVEHTGGVEDKDFGMIMSKNILVEFSEGAVTKKSDSDSIKSIITKTTEQIRLPYSKVVEVFPRGCVFALTTNNPQFLRDDSGSRRFMIVKFDQPADLEYLRSVRDQLFAEAVYRLTVKKEKFWWDVGEGIALEELQEKSTVGNIYDEVIETWYCGLAPEKREEGVLPIEAFNDIFGVDTEHPKEAGWSIEMKIISTFRRLLFLERGSTRLHYSGNGKVASRWLMTKKTKEHLNLSNKKPLPRAGSLDEFYEAVQEDMKEET